MLHHKKPNETEPVRIVWLHCPLAKPPNSSGNFGFSTFFLTFLCRKKSDLFRCASENLRVDPLPQVDKVARSSMAIPAASAAVAIA